MAKIVDTGGKREHRSFVNAFEDIRSRSRQRVALAIRLIFPPYPCGWQGTAAWVERWHYTSNSTLHGLLSSWQAALDYAILLRVATSVRCYGGHYVVRLVYDTPYRG